MRTKGKFRAKVNTKQKALSHGRLLRNRWCERTESGGSTGPGKLKGTEDLLQET